MPKLIDVVKLITSQVNDNELSSVVGSSEPFNQEIGEESFEKIKNQIGSFMTFDSAINNPKVVSALKERVDPDIKAEAFNKAKAEVYDGAEKKMSEELGSHFGIDLSGKRLSDQIKTLKEVKIGRSGNHKEEIEKLHQQLQKKDEAFEAFKKESNGKFDAFRVNTKIESLLNDYKLAEPYQDNFVKKGIFNNIVNEVKSKASLKITEDGNLGVFDKNDPTLEYYDGNKKATVKDLIDPLMSNYVVKSDGPKKVDTKVQAAPQDAKSDSTAGMMKQERQFI